MERIETKEIETRNAEEDNLARHRIRIGRRRRLFFAAVNDTTRFGCDTAGHVMKTWGHVTGEGAEPAPALPLMRDGLGNRSG